MSKPEITPARDHVVVCQQVVQRPSSLSPSQWLQFWERIVAREIHGTQP